MDLKFNGLDSIVSRLRQMENTEVIEKKALEAAGNHMKSKMETSAPVRTGTLKANIIVTGVKNGIIQVGTDQQGDGFHGYFLEYGKMCPAV